MTVGDAIRHLIEQIMPLARDGSFPEIVQVDFIPAETGDGSVLVYAHFCDPEVNNGLPVLSSFDIAEHVREEFEVGLFAAGALFKALHADGAALETRASQ
jgi:hypothetical protein